MLPNYKIILKEPNRLNEFDKPKINTFYTINNFLKYLEMTSSFPGLYNYENNENIYRWTVQYNVDHTSYKFIRLFDDTYSNISTKNINFDNKSIQSDILQRFATLPNTSQNPTKIQMTNRPPNTIPILTLINQSTLEYKIDYTLIPPNITFSQYTQLYNNPPFYFIFPGTNNQFISSFFPVNPFVSTSTLTDHFWWINMPEDYNYLNLFLENYTRNYNNTSIWYISDNGKTGNNKKNINKWFGFDGVNSILYPPSDNLIDVLPAILLYWWKDDNYKNLTITQT